MCSSDLGVDPSQIAIFGWGEYHPVASNDSPDGRNRNRRIAIVVLSDQGVPRRYYDNERRTVATPAMAHDAGGSAAALSAAPGPATHTPR